MFRRRPYERVRLGQHQVVTPFSPAEDHMVNELRLHGYGTTEIARMVNAYHGHNRSPATINMRLKSLAAEDEDDAS